jgi:hypothetical protein
MERFANLVIYYYLFKRYVSVCVYNNDNNYKVLSSK